MPFSTTEIVGDGMVQFRADARGVFGLRDEIHDLMDEAGKVGLAEMLARVPRSDESDNEDGTIADSLRVQSGPAFAPGGAGGGGFWQVAVGAGEDAPSHLDFVLQGTGLYGPVGNLIEPTSKRFMQFEASGVSWFLTETKGQRPQTEWLTDSQETVEQYIEAGLVKLRLGS